MWPPPFGITYFSGLPFSLLVAALGISAAIVALVVLRPTFAGREEDRIWPLLLLLAQLSLTAIFLREVRGGMIFSDDHPSFLYRFHLLYRAFPFIPIYNVDWNAGQISRELFSSGAQLLWYLGFPFAQLLGRFTTFEDAARYSLFIPYLFLILLPWCSYCAARLLSQSRRTATLTACFSFLPTTMFSEWVLGFGTIAFSAAMGLVPLVVALGARVLYTPETATIRIRAALVGTLWISLCWPLSFLCFVPLGVMIALRLPSLNRSGMLWPVLWPFLLVALLHLQSAITLLYGGKVAALLARDTLPGSHHTTSTHTREARPDISLVRMAQRLNPAIALFAIPGLLAVRERKHRRLLGFSALWLTLVSVAGLHFKPQLELPRLIIPAAFLLCMPAALGVQRLFHWALATSAEHERTLLHRLGAVAVAYVAVLSMATGPAGAATAYANRSNYRFVTAPPLVANLADAVKRFGGEGRTFISSFVLHDLGATTYKSQDGGHVALLPALAGKPFYASHYYHVYWNTVDPIPLSYRKRRAKGIEEFLDLINATAVISFRREWARYFAKNPRYREVFREGRFRLFTREPAPGGYFLSGSGELQPTPTGFRVIPGSEEMVLKFRYNTLLEVSDPRATIEPVFAFDEEVGSKETAPVSFIRLKVSPDALSAKLPIEVRSRWPAF